MYHRGTVGELGLAARLDQDGTLPGQLAGLALAVGLSLITVAPTRVPDWSWSPLITVSLAAGLVFLSLYLVGPSGIIRSRSSNCNSLAGVTPWPGFSRFCLLVAALMSGSLAAGQLSGGHPATAPYRRRRLV